MARGRKDYEKAVVAVESEGFVNPHGRILLHDDFEDTPLKWLTAGTGTHFETRQARAAYNGSYGLELDVTAALPPIPDFSTAYRLIPIDITERILVELFWRHNDPAALRGFHIQLLYYNGTHRSEARLTYAAATPGWWYVNDVGIPTFLPGSQQLLYANAWNELTIAADFAQNEYITFKSNNIEVNMGGIPCQSILSGLGAHLQIEIETNNNTANQLLVDVDDVIARELEV
jgi:hypothetical protein